MDNNDAQRDNPAQKPKRKPKLKTLVVDKLKTLTLRISEPERADLEAKAEASFRSLNAQSVHLIKLFLRRSMSSRQAELVKEFSMLNSKKYPSVSTLPLRIPVEVHARLKDQAVRSGCSLNCLIRYALFAKSDLEP